MESEGWLGDVCAVMRRLVAAVLAPPGDNVAASIKAAMFDRENCSNTYEARAVALVGEIDKKSSWREAFARKRERKK